MQAGTWLGRRGTVTGNKGKERRDEKERAARGGPGLKQTHSAQKLIPIYDRMFKKMSCSSK